jgi:hypothetical protein
VKGFSGTVIGDDLVYLEWPPGRTGTLIARHSERPADAVEQLTKSEGSSRMKRSLVRANGNSIEESRELFLMLDDGNVCVMPFHGTGHTTVRELMTYLAQLRHPDTGKILPAAASRFRFTTASKSNELGAWYRVRFQWEGYNGKPAYLEAKRLAELVAPRAA